LITPVGPMRTGLIQISPRYQTVYRLFEIILEWELSRGWNSNPMFYGNSLLQKTFNLM